MIASSLCEAARRLHRRVVGTGIGDRTHAVLAGTGWVVGSALAARVVTGITTLLAMRWLGPEQLGRANLALAATFWLQVPLFMGLPAAILNTVPKADPAQRASWVRTGNLLLASSAALTVLLALLLRSPLASLFGIGTPELLVGVAWCVGFAVHAAASTSLAAMERFRARGVAEVAFALAMAAAVLALRARDRLTWDSHVHAMGLAYLLVGLAAFALARVPLPRVEPGAAERAGALLRFGAVVLAGSVAIALTQATGRLVAHRWFGDAEVGVLSAYSGGSVQLASYLQGLLVVVFFPVASRTPDRAALRRKIDRLLPALILGGAALFVGVLLAWMLLLGSAYPLRAGTVAAFAVASGLTVASGIVSWMLASGGRRGAVAASVTWLAFGVVNAGACLVLVPAWGTLGAGLAAIAGGIAGIASSRLPFVARWAGVA